MRVTATEAKNRCGSVCAQTKRDPAFVEKAEPLDSVILSSVHDQALGDQHDSAGRAERKRAVEAEFGDWLAAHHAHFESHGIPGADLRPW